MRGARWLPFRARLALSLLMCYLPPVLSYLILGAEGPLIPLLAYCAAVELLFFLRSVAIPRPEVKRLLGILLVLLVGCGGFVVFAAIDITPASAYLAWFRLVRSGVAGGTIAYLFATDYAFFSSLFAGLFLAVEPWSALLGLSFVVLFLTAVILKSALLGACSLVVIALIVFRRALRRSEGSRRGALVAAAQLVGAAAVLAFVLTPAMLRNGLVDRIFSIDLEGPIARAFPGFPFLYSVPGYGHSFGRSDEGGRPALTSRPVFKVTAAAGETLYLRTAVFDHYTGGGWELSEGARRAAAPPAGTWSGRVGVRPSAQGTLHDAATTPVHITVLIDFIAALPVTLDTVAIVPTSGALPPLAYGSPATGYVLSVPITSGTRITDYRSGKAAHSVVTRKLDRAERGEYLQTGGVPGEVRALARRLNRATHPATIAAIRAYLASDFSYSLNIPRYRPHTDVVSDFLFGNRAGYCVQFATAFTILARLDGIPTRYVTGFLVNLPEGSDTTVVTGLSAHAWSEVWVDGAWETVEATPPMMSASLQSPGYYSEFNPTDSRFTRRQLRAVMGARVGLPPQQPGSSGPTLARAAEVAAFGGAICVTACLLFFLLRAGLLALLPLPLKIGRTVKKTVQRTRAFNLPDPARDGWRRWGKEVGRLTRRPAVMQRAATIVLGLKFGGRLPARRDAVFLRWVYRALRRLGRTDQQLSVWPDR